MRLLVLAFVFGFFGYQIGRSSLSDSRRYVIEKKSQIADGLETVSYLKIGEDGSVSFVQSKELASILSGDSARNALSFLMGIYKDSNVNLIAA